MAKKQRFKSLENYFQSFGKKVIKQAGNNIRKISPDAGKKMKFSVKREDKGFSITFFAPQHLQALDYGVHGKDRTNYYVDYKGKRRRSKGKGYKDKMPPSDVFEKWMRKKGIRGRNPKTGRFQTRQSAAFAMAKNMQLKGRKGLSFFQKSLSIEYKKMNKNIAKHIENDLAQLINSTK